MLAWARLVRLSFRELSGRVKWREVMDLGGGSKGWVTQGAPGYSSGVGVDQAGGPGRDSLVESGAQN